MEHFFSVIPLNGQKQKYGKWRFSSKRTCQIKQEETYRQQKTNSLEIVEWNDTGNDNSLENMATSFIVENCFSYRTDYLAGEAPS